MQELIGLHNSGHVGRSLFGYVCETANTGHQNNAGEEGIKTKVKPGNKNNFVLNCKTLQVQVGNM